MMRGTRVLPSLKRIHEAEYRYAADGDGARPAVRQRMMMHFVHGLLVCLKNVVVLFMEEPPTSSIPQLLCCAAVVWAARTHTT